MSCFCVTSRCKLLAMVSRIKDATIHIAATKADKVRDLISPHLTRTYECLPIALQATVKELGLGRPVRELTLAGIRTVGIGILERVEAMLNAPGIDDDSIDIGGGDESSDDTETSSLASSRVSRVPRILGLHKLWYLVAQISESATFPVTVAFMQDAAFAVMKRLRVQEALEPLRRNVLPRLPVFALVAKSAKCSCKAILGEWLFACIFGTSAQQQASGLDASKTDDLGVNAIEISQVVDGNAEEQVGAHGEPVEFRLVIKNSFIELNETPACEIRLRRANSWQSMRGEHRSISSEPFTLQAHRWTSRGAPSASLDSQPAQEVGTSQHSTPESAGAAGNADFVGQAHAPLHTCRQAPGPVAASAGRVVGAASVSAALSTFGPPGALVSSVAVASTEPPDQTTVILRGIPTRYTRTDLFALLDACGLAGRCVFIYLPIDFSRGVSLRYAIVCMDAPSDAELLMRCFDGFKAWGSLEDGSCHCEASRGEPRQTLQEHIERYRNSPIMHESVPDLYKPALFSAGRRVAFPSPTKALRAPRIRQVKTSQESAVTASNS